MTGIGTVDQSCCFRIHNANTCANIKESTLTIWTAITTIVLIGSILAFLAMQKYDLGIINSIPAHIGQAGVYTALIGSALFTAMNIFLIIATIRHYQNKQYTEAEIIKSGLKEHIDNEGFQSKLFANQYRAFSFVMDENTNEKGYVIVVPNGIYAFKEPETQAGRIEALEAKGYVDGSTSREYPIPYLFSDKSAFDQYCLTLNKPQTKFEYNLDEYDDVDTGLKAFVIVTKDNKPRFFESAVARHNALEDEYQGYLNSDEVGVLIENELGGRPISIGRFHLGTVEVNGKTLFYASSPGSQPDTLYSFDYKTLADSIGKKWPNCCLSFGSIDEILGGQPNEQVEFEEKKAFPVVAKNLPTTPELFGFAEGANNGATKYYIYTTEEARDAAFNASDKIDQERAQEILMSFKETSHAALLLKEDGKNYYEGIALQDDGTYQVVEAKNADFFVVYQNVNGQIESEVVYVEPKHLDNIAKEIKDSGEYPPALAEVLVNGVPGIGENKTLVTQKGKKSLIAYDKVQKTGDARYPEIYPVIVCDDSGKIELRAYHDNKAKIADVSQLKNDEGYQMANAPQKP